MKLLVLYFIILLSYNTLFSQNIVRTSSSSETKHISLDKKKSVVIDQNALKPVIYFLNPVFKEQDNVQKKVTSKLKVFNIKGITYTKDGSGINELSINDKKISLNENDQFEETVILSPGSNQFLFISNSNSGGVKYDTLWIDYVKPETKYFIFQIAIDDYAKWPDLSNPVKNALVLDSILINKYGFNNGEVINLFNNEATLDNIYEKFQYLIRTVSPNDKLLIFFSGHGHYDNIIEEGYWIPYEARKDKTSDYITNSEIVNFIKAIDSKHTLLIADACFAGSMMELAMRGNEEINYENYDKRRSRWVFTSGRIEKVEDKSLFTEQIIKILEHNQKPHILFTEISEQVIEAVSANTDQMPVCAPIKYANHEGGQFVFHLEK